MGLSGRYALANYQRNQLPYITNRRGDTGIIGSDRNKGLKRRAMFPFCLELDSLILSKKRDVG
jgi:hypothetical protein